MKSSRRSMFLQGGLLALMLLGFVYLVWQRYHRPAARTYEGKTLDQWLEDLDDPDYHINERAASVLADAGAESVPILLDACEHGEVRLHRRSAAVLVRLGAAAAPGLAAVLRDKATQRQVEVALVRLGAAAVPALREALTEEKGGEAAAHVLGLIGPRAADAVPDLIAALNRSQSPTTLRCQAVFALGRIGEPTGNIVPALIAALIDKKSEVREQAAEALGGIGPSARTSVPALSAALKDEETKVAIKACQTLSFIDDAEAAPFLLAAFQGNRPEVAAEAGRALWRMGPKAESIVPALLSAAQGPIDKSVPARELLASFGPAIVPVLVKALHEGEAAQRESAAHVLGRIGPPARAAVPALIDALKDKSSSVALMAAMALAQVDSTRCGAAVKLLADALDVPGAALALANIGPDARSVVPALIAALKPSKEAVNPELIQAGARLALARIGTPAVPALIEALKDKREDVAPLAGEALGWVLPPPKEAVPALLAALKADRAHAAIYAHALGKLGPLARSAVPDLTELLMDPASRPAAAAALVRIDPHQAEKVAPLLVEEFQADDEKQRQAAVLALTHLGSAAQPAAPALAALICDRRLTEREIHAFREIWTGAISNLIDLLKDPEVDCRKRAVFALGQIGPSASAVLQPLIAALADREDAVRAGAAQIVQEIGPQASEAVPALIANLRARPAELRAAAAAALGHIEAAAKEALKPLLECLLDPDENVRYAAALSLGRIDPHFREAVPALRDASHDSSPMVQLAAIDSLGRIEPAASKDTGPILAALSRTPYPLGVRFRAVEGIANLEGFQVAKQAAPWLGIELTDADPGSRLYAAGLLAHLDPDRTSAIVLSLAAALATPLADWRPDILKRLRQFGPKAREAAPEIERLLYDGTPGVRPEAIRTLQAVNPARVKQLGIE